jgi:alpha-D-xyloside xylohydrolase
MRGLVMDFPGDRKAWNVADQYMFGPAFLVAPVTQFKARTRQVYLPAGTSWYDFYTGRSEAGGRTIKADAPYERMPLFVRAGSIVPIGPEIQHTAQAPGGPVTLNVYTGADGQFSLYEDDGTSMQYANGQFARIPMRYDERTGTLTVGAREGSYPGMAVNRTINIRWMTPGRARALELDGKADAAINYTGVQQSVKLKR